MTFTRTRIFLPRRGFGMCFTNMIHIISGEASAELDTIWIDVEERQPQIFTLVDENLTDVDGDSISDNTALGFSSWDVEVQDLDEGYSDSSQCFGISNHLVWKDVELTTDTLHAPSIERLIEALARVEFCAWCPGDI